MGTRHGAAQAGKGTPSAAPESQLDLWNEVREMSPWNRHNESIESEERIR
jgi:hypothetical protein